ncbi:hypothetical protein BOG92_034740 [Streptomyces sp. WAC00263]|nr:hypothetical protein BOG92_034740 [Streptomyces sp. WAC00263]
MPTPPVLVRLVREHVTEFGTAEDGKPARRGVPCGAPLVFGEAGSFPSRLPAPCFHGSRTRGTRVCWRRPFGCARWCGHRRG